MYRQVITHNCTIHGVTSRISALYNDVHKKRLQFIQLHFSRNSSLILSFFFKKSPIMTSTIPTSSSVTESTVIQAPLSAVWHLIKLQEFDKFWTRLEKSEHVEGTSPEAYVVKWTFKDGTKQEVKQEEHSVLHMFTAYTLELQQKRNGNG